MDFQAVADALNDIQSVSSTLTKQMLLKKYGEEIPGFKEVLKYIYDPCFTTGIKSAKLDKWRMNGEPSNPTPEWIMKYLRSHNTGSDEAVGWAIDFIEQFDDPIAAWAAEGLVTKDLQIGVSVTTLNKVFGVGFIPKIGIMRGMLCPEDWTGWGIATEKIDGNRRLFFNTVDGVYTFTRSGKPDTGLTEIEKEIAEHLPTGYVYDCECVAEGNYGDNIALRQASASVLNRRNRERSGVRALCFDMLSIEEYNAGKSKLNALGRKALLAAVTGDVESCNRLTDFALMLDIERGTKYHNALHALVLKYANVLNTRLQHFKSLPILGFAKNYEDGVQLARPVWDVKGEGIMLVEWQSPYEVNPNPRKTLLKIKMLKEYEAVVTDIYEGDNKYTGMMGGIIVNWDGNSFGVGTGFTDWERAIYWRDPDKIVGKTVELESFGESINKLGGRALNCPVFKRIKGANE